jgi:serine/threonine protein kinase
MATRTGTVRIGTIHAIRSGELSGGSPVGEYRLIERISLGDGAAVWEAARVVDGKRVALKLQHSEVGSSTFAKRLRSEAHILMRVKHPNLVRGLALGEVDGRVYSVTEWIDGPTIEQALERGPFTAHRAIQIARDVLGALRALHEQGVVHRDVKPSNVMLRPDGSAVLIDCSIARLTAGGSGIPVPGITDHGVTVGTSGAMAPEQLAGEADHRSDIFSAGLLLAWLVAGENPLGGISAEAEQRLASLPPGVLSAMTQAMDASADKRFQSASAFASALVVPTEPPNTTSIFTTGDPMTFDVAPTVDEVQAQRSYVAPTLDEVATLPSRQPVVPTEPQRRRSFALPASIMFAVVVITGGVLTGRHLAKQRDATVGDSGQPAAPELVVVAPDPTTPTTGSAVVAPQPTPRAQNRSAATLPVATVSSTPVATPTAAPAIIGSSVTIINNHNDDHSSTVGPVNSNSTTNIYITPAAPERIPGMPTNPF